VKRKVRAGGLNFSVLDALGAAFEAFWAHSRQAGRKSNNKDERTFILMKTLLKLQRQHPFEILPAAAPRCPDFEKSNFLSRKKKGLASVEHF
jgi:hypothetical protein